MTPDDTKEKPFHPRPRDYDILEAAHDHRYVTTHHIHALLGEHDEVGNIQSNTGLIRRMRRMVENNLLKVLSIPESGEFSISFLHKEKKAYALANVGARMLHEEKMRKGENPHPQLTEADWGRLPQGPIKHELLVTTATIAVRLAAKRRELNCAWTGYPDRESYKLIAVKRDGSIRFSIQPDGYFTVTLSRHGQEQQRHYFLEVDRASFTVPKMVKRYIRYFDWWKAYDQEAKRLGEEHPHKHMQVLTITQTEAHMKTLRDAAEVVGRSKEYPRPWQALAFTHFHAFDLVNPERFLYAPLFLSPGAKEPSSLL